METISVYRKMSAAEANATLDTMMLQPPIRGTDTSKYLSESLSKVEAFQNKIVSQGTQEDIIEFVLDKQGYNSMMANAVPQAGSKGVNAIKFHYEGLNPVQNPNVRNIGVPETMLDEFNRITLDIKKLKNGN